MSLNINNLSNRFKKKKKKLSNSRWNEIKCPINKTLLSKPLDKKKASIVGYLAAHALESLLGTMLEEVHLRREIKI